MVPIINASTLASSETLRELDLACRHWGVFQLVDHGLQPDIVRNLHAQMREFFALPLIVKRRVQRSEDNPWGFYDRELTKNVLDIKEVYDYGPGDGDNMVPQWPSTLAEFQPALEAHYHACEELSFNLIEALGRNLGASPGQLTQAFRPDHTSFLRLNYYPCVEVDSQGDGALGINPHTDAGALTVLHQDQQAGLEIRRKEQWHLVEPVENALVINIGDIIQVWSNDRYRAPLHRVIASYKTARYSAPFFFNPSYATEYQPLASTIGADSPCRYHPINWGEFRAGRALGDYADHGEEVQISHYRI